MPTYEYACTSCGHHLEVVQSFQDEPLTECPACGAPLRKVFGAVGIVLKGSGFYKTDSRNSSAGRSGKEPAGGGTGAAGTGAKEPAAAKRGVVGRERRGAGVLDRLGELGLVLTGHRRGRLLGPRRRRRSGAAQLHVADRQGLAGGDARQPLHVAPMWRIDCSMRWRVEATVTSRTGSASSPPRIIRPSAPTEKSPLTGFTPECTPVTDCT